MRFTIAALVFGLVAAPANAAGSDAGHEVRAALLSAADHIEADYIEAGQAPALAARLRAEAAAMRRRPLIGTELADFVTRLLRSASGDEHFLFDYTPTPQAPESATPPTAAEAATETLLRARATNFGILKAERLPGNIGLIDFDNFAAPADLRRPLAAAIDLLGHCDAMILDLRNSGGGQARGAALIASYFLPGRPARPLVRLSNREQSLDIGTEESLEAVRFLDRPVFVLVGPRTFSAAEMLAAVLQESGRAQIVGTRTRGGGNPIARIRLSEHYRMLLPVTRSVTAGGRSWQGIGVAPDRVVDSDLAMAEARRAAFRALLSERPDDPLAGLWRTSLDRISSEANQEGDHR